MCKKVLKRTKKDNNSDCLFGDTGLTLCVQGKHTRATTRSETSIDLVRIWVLNGSPADDTAGDYFERELARDHLFAALLILHAILVVENALADAQTLWRNL